VCETWSPILRVVQRLKVYENRVLTKKRNHLDLHESNRKEKITQHGTS